LLWRWYQDAPLPIAALHGDLTRQVVRAKGFDQDWRDDGAAPSLSESDFVAYKDRKHAGQMISVQVSRVTPMTAVGMTPAELEKEIIKLYSSQLVPKEVTVTVVSSSFPVFVSGAVIRPGKILSDHPITALEAIMEAGGFDYTKANLGHVTVIRNEGGRVKNYTLNLCCREGRASPFT
jgi:hypothetical protein